MTSVYLAKCKRLRTDGPTPCLCCDGECFGDVCTYPGCDCGFDWGSVIPMPRDVCRKATDKSGFIAWLVRLWRG